MSYTPKNEYRFRLKKSGEGEKGFKKSLLSELTTETVLSESWNYDGIGSHDNTEYLLYQGHDYLKCSHGLVTGDLLDEDCADISDWVDNDNINGVSQVNPAGCFEFHTHTAAANNWARRYRDIGSMPDKVTFEIRVKHNALGTIANEDEFGGYISDASTVFGYKFASDGCFIYNGSWVEIGANLVIEGESQWQIWRFVIDFVAKTVDIYLHDVSHATEKVATGQAFTSATAATDGMLYLWQCGQTTNDRITYIDYVRLQDGFIPIDVLLNGTWTSPEYDLGATRLARVQGVLLTLFVNSDATWDALFPITSKWSDVISSITQWSDIIVPIPPEELEIKLKWGTVSGVYPNEEFFYNVVHEVEARYLQVEIEITDLSLSSNLYVGELDCTASYWS